MTTTLLTIYTMKFLDSPLYEVADLAFR